MNTDVPEALERLKLRSLYRSTQTYAPLDATHVAMAGRRCLMLASNNYLGLTHHPAVQKGAIEAISLYGTGSGGSRLTTGSHPLFEQLEAKIAGFKGAEAALVFNTGYMANLGVISTLAGPQDVIFSDELNHASIIDGCRLSKARVVVYRHNDMADLEEKLGSAGLSGKLVVTDGVFSMDGDIAPLPEIVRLARRYQAWVMVDDAHATGVLGERGGGTAQYFGLEGAVDVQMGTLSKALASEGGYIAGSRQLIEYIKNIARSFIFSTALSPATIGAAIAAMDQVLSGRDLICNLSRNTALVRGELTAAGFQVIPGSTPIIAVLIGDEVKTMAFAAELLRAGIVVSGIRPPTVPEGTSRLRVTVSAAHTADELKQALYKFREIGSELAVI